MRSPEVPTPEPAEVVVLTGFTSLELTEMQRGLVQRLTVAQSNIRDKRNTDDVPDWRDIYETCCSAYTKIIKAVEHANHTLINDEFSYLSRPVGED